MSRKKKLQLAWMSNILGRNETIIVLWSVIESLSLYQLVKQDYHTMFKYKSLNLFRNLFILFNTCIFRIWFFLMFFFKSQIRLLRFRKVLENNNSNIIILLTSTINKHTCGILHGDFILITAKIGIYKLLFTNG